MKYILILLFFAFIAGCKPAKITPTQAVQKLGSNPYFVVDEQPIDKSQLMKIDPKDIASVTVYYGQDAVKQFGEKAKDGAVFSMTKNFATIKYEAFFKSYSKEYERVLKEYDKADIQYILNDRVLIENFEGDLASINNQRVKGVKILDPKKLAEQFHITDKKIGILILAKPPKGLYNAKKKF